MTERVNKWERDGFGIAPFRVVGIAELPSKALLEANPSAYNNAMASLPKGYRLGSCHICGTALTVNYLINDATGSKFAVGCECVKKTGDTAIGGEVHALKLKRARDKRADARETRRIRLYAENSANWYAGEVANWGLHPTEARHIIAKADKARKATVLAELADILADGRYGFRDDVANGLRRGELPYGRGFTIMLEIIGKVAGRKNSKAYKAEVSRVEAIVESVNS